MCTYSFKKSGIALSLKSTTLTALEDPLLLVPQTSH